MYLCLAASDEGKIDILFRYFGIRTSKIRRKKSTEMQKKNQNLKLKMPTFRKGTQKGLLSCFNFQNELHNLTLP